MESLSFIFNFCSAVKPHPSFFLKIMFNFLCLQHYVLRNGSRVGRSLSRWPNLSACFLKGVVKCVLHSIRP